LIHSNLFIPERQRAAGAMTLTERTQPSISKTRSTVRAPRISAIGAVTFDEHSIAQARVARRHRGINAEESPEVATRVGYEPEAAFSRAFNIQAGDLFPFRAKILASNRLDHTIQQPFSAAPVGF
jgi:hypothetical protein